MFIKNKLGTYIVVLLLLGFLAYTSYDIYFSEEAKARECVSEFLWDVQHGGTGEQYLAPAFTVSVENKINNYSFMMTQKCTEPGTYLVDFRIKNINNISTTAVFKVVDNKIAGIAESF